ncbi:MAG: hypothetical protein R2932_38870 [Caldilineaceae bacterium]
MARQQLMEIHEQPWCPAVIRTGATDYLRFIATVARQYRHVVPLLDEALANCGSRRIIDLCSGSGGPWGQLIPQLNALRTTPVAVTLTDLYPDQAPPAELLPAHVHFAPMAVDATAIPVELSGLRTLFTAFHHFSPPAARAILQDAMNAGQGIAIFEQTARTPLALLVMLFLPWLTIVAAPFVRPWRWSRLFWTLVVPVIPVVLCVDGVVSCLRTYSMPELQALIATLEPTPNAVHYRWQLGHVRSPLSPIGIHYVVGCPAGAQPGCTPRVAPTK